MEATAATIDNHPMWVNLEPAYPVLEGYPEAELDRKTLALIAADANSKGVSFPTIKTMAEKLGETAKRVWCSVQRLIAKGLIKVLRKEKKYQDKHPRNIYQVVKALLRTEPDKTSSHFNAEKWKPFAARLKKFVSDAVDTVKQVAVTAAENMSARKRKPRKQWNNSYRSYGDREPVLTPEELERKHWTQQLILQAQDDLSKAGMGDGYYPALRFIADHVEKTSEQYDSILQDAIARFKDYVKPDPMEAYEQDANGHWWLKKSYESHVPDIRLTSSEDEPLGFKGALGAAFA
jgi:hypothetical protein